jgi:hypothetical protein
MCAISCITAATANAVSTATSESVNRIPATAAAPRPRLNAPTSCRKCSLYGGNGPTSVKNDSGAAKAHSPTHASTSTSGSSGHGRDHAEVDLAEADPDE